MHVSVVWYCKLILVLFMGQHNNKKQGIAYSYGVSFMSIFQKKWRMYHTEVRLYAGIILCMCPANESWCYTVTPPLIGWAHAQNDPWVWPYLSKRQCIEVDGDLSMSVGSALAYCMLGIFFDLQKQYSLRMSFFCGNFCMEIWQLDVICFNLFLNGSARNHQIPHWPAILLNYSLWHQLMTQSWIVALWSELGWEYCMVILWHHVVQILR